MLTVLFFDDWHLSRRVNLERHVGSPTLVPEGTIEDPHTDPAWGYPSVLRDPDTGRWRCYYEGRVPRAGNRFIPVVAESDDGVHWELPDLSGQVDIPDRLAPHQLLDVEGFGAWCSVFEDEHTENADERYKALAAPIVWASPDGIRWSRRESMKWSKLGADPGYFAFWNQYRNTWVMTLRPKVGDRRIAVNETADWVTFTDPEWAMQPDALDTPGALIYGMPVFPYEQIFIGLAWMFHVDPVIDLGEKYIGGLADAGDRLNEEHARVMGKIDCQLAYSLDGWHFQRTLRDPFIPTAPPGEHGSGTVYPSSMIVDGDAIRIYSSATRGEHAQVVANVEKREAAILTHTLRRDGFVYLEPSGGTGELITRFFLWRSGEPNLNVNVPYGQAIVQITDADGRPLEGYTYEDSIPFTGDSTDWTPRWRDGRTVAALRDKVVRMGVRLANGRLYAIRGDLEFITLPEARRHLVSQNVPGYTVRGGPTTHLPGFYTAAHES